MSIRTLPVILICLLILLPGCSSLKRNAIPLDQIYDAEVVGIPKVRAWAGQYSTLFQKDIVNSIEQEREGLFEDPATGRKDYKALAISGGGANGAFGAGLLYGWTRSGKRPLFKLVTGISTGALIAPFALLGPSYDEQLKEVYTTVTTKDIVKKRSILNSIITGESFSDSAPLRHLIGQYVTWDLLEAIAAAHDRGKRLYVGTTHMDAQRFVIWNMGLIAKSTSPLALQFFKEIMLASSSIPSVMAPVFIKVKVDGREYDEMHTDGGTIAHAFVHAGTFSMVKAGKTVGLNLNGNLCNELYIIVNGKLAPVAKQTSRKLSEISARALYIMLSATAKNNLYRMYVFAQREKSEFFYTSMPEDYVSNASEPFDQEEMKRVFEIGQELGESGNPWTYFPPNYEESLNHPF